jgi:hypothetical protein
MATPTQETYASRMESSPRSHDCKSFIPPYFVSGEYMVQANKVDFTSVDIEKCQDRRSLDMLWPQKDETYELYQNNTQEGKSRARNWADVEKFTLDGEQIMVSARKVEELPFPLMRED